MYLKDTVKRPVIILALAFCLYLASMIDFNALYLEKLIDCHLGKHTFTLMRKDCRDWSFYELYH